MFEISDGDYLSTQKPAHNCFQIQEMCKKAVDGYDFRLKFVPYCDSTQEMCKRAIIISNLTLEFVLDSFMIQDMCKKSLFKNTLYVKIMYQQV